jgi:hypothetical protein
MGISRPENTGAADPKYSLGGVVERAHSAYSMELEADDGYPMILSRCPMLYAFL